MSVVTWVGGAAGSYGVSLAVNWTGGIAPGAADIASFSATQTGPYTLLGDAGWAGMVLNGDTITITGSITAPDVQISNGAVADAGVLSFATFTIGAQGVLGVGDTGTLAGNIVLDGGQLAALGSTVSLDNAIQLMNNSAVLASMPTGTLVLSGGVSGAYGLDVLSGTAAFAALSSYTGAPALPLAARLRRRRIMRWAAALLRSRGR